MGAAASHSGYVARARRAVGKNLKVDDEVRPSARWLKDYHGEVRQILRRLRGKIVEIEPVSSLFSGKILVGCVRVRWSDGHVQDVRAQNVERIWRPRRS